MTTFARDLSARLLTSAGVATTLTNTLTFCGRHLVARLSGKCGPFQTHTLLTPNRWPPARAVFSVASTSAVAYFQTGDQEGVGTSTPCPRANPRERPWQ